MDWAVVLRGNWDECVLLEPPPEVGQAVATRSAARQPGGGRWGKETTFEDARACLGLESTRGRCKRTVTRAEPCLRGLYSVVALLYWLLPPAAQAAGEVAWEGKETVTFSDAITAVRRWLWTQPATTAEGFRLLRSPWPC